ncbi:hypothetical protein RRG08_009058 [Elysia crispata]|uniref:Uncharacterized protein n=1 Tax=Elysia crispata TaxID=231223 RepID=A0AAE1ADU7_9GAST|nr:hypothetical protein RRG08_009058 [Elysia crispata]
MKVPEVNNLRTRELNPSSKNVETSLQFNFKQSSSYDRQEERLVTSRGTKSEQSSKAVRDKRDNDTLEVSSKSPYEISSSFNGRKLLAVSSPNFNSAAKSIAASPIETDTFAKQLSEKNAKIKKEVKNGPTVYMAKWPALREKMLALKKKISAARKKLDEPVNLLLERIDEGDQLKKQASHVSNLQRLEHFGKTPNTKTVTALKNTYKALDKGIAKLGGQFSQIEGSLTGKSVNVDVQKLERELRKRMQFVAPDVESAIDSGWSAITSSLADTTNFQYSVLTDTPPSPVFSIYRFGDEHGEKTYLKEDLKNMQRSIDSLSIESMDTTDPDLQRVDKVLKNLLSRTRLTNEIEAEHSIDNMDVNKKMKNSFTFDENDIYFGVDHHQDANVGDEMSTIKDGVFYLFDSRNRPENILRSNEEGGTEFHIDLTPGAVTDKTSGGGVPGAQSQLDVADIFDEEHDLHTDSDIQNGKYDEVAHGIISGNADEGMKTVDGLSIGGIKRKLHRRKRSTIDPEHAGARKKIVVKGNVIHGDDDESVQRNVHTMVDMPYTGGDKPPTRRKSKSKEDTQSFNMVDMVEIDKKKAAMGRKMPEYKVEDEVDETGDEGSDVLFAMNNLPFESYDKVPLKESLAETVKKYDDQEFEDESMELGSVNNQDIDSGDMSFYRDTNLMKAYKTSLNLRPSLPETVRATDPNYNRINDGLAGDFRLAPGEIVEETDNPIYRLDDKYPATGPNAGREVGSLAFWNKEIQRLDETERRNKLLAGKLQKGFIGEGSYGQSPLSRDLVFLGGKKSSPRVSDLFSDQVREIIKETQEKDNTVHSGRKRLPPWRKDFNFGAEVSEDNELERRKEDELVSLINPGLDVMVRRMEKIEASKKPGSQDLAEVNKVVLSLLDDAPVNPEEFDYLRQLADVSVFTKPVNSNPATLEDNQPKDKLTLTALKGLDRAAKTLKQIDEDMKSKQREQLKKELADAEKLRRQVKVDEEKKRMEKMWEHIKAIPKMEAITEDLRKKRVRQYEYLRDYLHDAYNQRVKIQKQNYKKYLKLFKKMKKVKKEIDALAKYP